MIADSNRTNLERLDPDDSTAELAMDSAYLRECMGSVDVLVAATQHYLQPDVDTTPEQAVAELFANSEWPQHGDAERFARAEHGVVGLVFESQKLEPGLRTPAQLAARAARGADLDPENWLLRCREGAELVRAFMLKFFSVDYHEEPIEVLPG